MATTTGYQNFIKPPEQLLPNGDLDHFILELKRFFELTQQPLEFQDTLTKAFLSVELVTKYEETTGVGYEDRLRKAFEPRKNLAVDLDAALRYRRNNENCNQFFEKVEKLVDNILRHKLTKPALMMFLIQHAIEDVETKKELKMRDVKSIDKARDVIQRMEDIQKELEGEQSLAALHRKESYSGVTRSSKPWNINKNEPKVFQSKNFDNRQPYQRESYSRKTEFQPRKCWVCGETGHIRAECKNVRCHQCGKNGHFKYQCWETRQSNVGSRENNYRRDHRQHEDRRPIYNKRFTRSESNDSGRGSRSQFNAMSAYSDEFDARNGNGDHDDAIQPKDEAPALREALGAINVD